MSSTLPRPDQLLLLRAALSDGDDALRAWARWSEQVGLDAAERASQRLLPLVYANLRRLGADDPELPRLKGLYRHAWYRNQLLFRRVAEVVRRFREAGVETLVLKGIALSVLHYRDSGVRPMEDADVLVRPDRAAEAVGLLLASGWRPLEVVPAYLEVKHAHPFEHEAGERLDLHWNALWEAAPDDDLWSAAVPLEVAGEPTLALDPTDQLLHVCVHGVQWDPTPAIRWVADAVTVDPRRGDRLGPAPRAGPGQAADARSRPVAPVPPRRARRGGPRGARSALSRRRRIRCTSGSVTAQSRGTADCPGGWC